MPAVPIENLLTQKQLVALGKVAAYSAELEASLEFLICMALKLKEHEADAILERLSMNLRIELLEKIVPHKTTDKDAKDNFALLLANLKTLNAERNTVIHGRWGTKGNKVSLADIVLMAKGPMPSELIEAKNKKRRFSPTDLESLASKLHEASSRVWDFHRMFVKYPKQEKVSAPLTKKS